MPPIHQYTFSDSKGTYSTIITLWAYNFEEAMEKLVKLVKHPTDFILQ